MKQNDPNNQKSGKICLVGRSNVGKSTLLNALIGEKVSIVTNKPQTTRYNTLGVKHLDNNELVFIDTPGVHANSYNKQLNRQMNRDALGSLHGADIIGMVIQINDLTKEDFSLIEKIQDSRAPKIAIINKLDLVKTHTKSLPFINKIHKLGIFTEIISISALFNRDLDLLEQYFSNHLPQRPWSFSPEQKSVIPEKYKVSEIIREAVFNSVFAEVPYAVTVEIEKSVMVKKHLHINASIVVESDGQKKIIIGRGGQMIKEIGTNARLELEKLLQQKVFLKLFVRTVAGWTNDPTKISSEV